MYKAMGMEWNNFREIYRQKRGFRVKGTSVETPRGWGDLRAFQ